MVRVRFLTAKASRIQSRALRHCSGRTFIVAAYCIVAIHFTHQGRLLRKHWKKIYATGRRFTLLEMLPCLNNAQITNRFNHNNQVTPLTHLRFYAFTPLRSQFLFIFYWIGKNENVSFCFHHWLCFRISRIFQIKKVLDLSLSGYVIVGKAVEETRSQGSCVIESIT